MAWEDIMKKEPYKVANEIRLLRGKEGKLEDIMKMIDEKFNVKSSIIYDSSSQPVIGFELPFYVRCVMGTKDSPSDTSRFTVKNVGLNTSEIR